MAKGVMFELGVYFGARGVAKNDPLRPPPAQKYAFLHVFCPWRAQGPPRAEKLLGRRSKCPFWSTFWRGGQIRILSSPPLGVCVFVCTGFVCLCVRGLCVCVYGVCVFVCTAPLGPVNYEVLRRPASPDTVKYEVLRRPAPPDTVNYHVLRRHGPPDTVKYKVLRRPGPPGHRKTRGFASPGPPGHRKL